MVVGQGDIFWADLGPASGSEAAGRRPVLVVQHDSFNRSAINTVVVVPLTTQRRLAAMPGNATLKRGDANLPRSSVANVSQIAAIDRDKLGDKIGTVSELRLQAVLKGVLILLKGAPRNPI